MRFPFQPAAHKPHAYLLSSIMEDEISVERPINYYQITEAWFVRLLNGTAACLGSSHTPSLASNAISPRPKTQSCPAGCSRSARGTAASSAASRSIELSASPPRHHRRQTDPHEHSPGILPLPHALQ